MANPGIKPFSFLEGKIKVIVIDDDPIFLDLYSEFLGAYKLYHVTCLPCAKEAYSILASGAKYHVCIIDLGITDINGDEFCLVKTFCDKASFVVVSGRDSLEKGFQAKSCGVLAALSKHAVFQNLGLIDCINEAFFRSLFLVNVIHCKPVIKMATDSFFSKPSPQSVLEWSQRTCIEQQYLRKIWVDYFGYQPRYVIRFYKMYAEALRYYNYLFCKKFNLESPINVVHAFNPELPGSRFNKLIHSHEKMFTMILGG